MPEIGPPFDPSKPSETVRAPIAPSAQHTSVADAPPFDPSKPSETVRAPEQTPPTQPSFWQQLGSAITMQKPSQPPLDLGAIAKGVAGLPQEFARQSEAHKGETLTQRLRDPKDLQTAMDIALVAGPSSLPGVGAPQVMARPAALAARKAGYVLPPTSISKNPGMVSEMLAGWGGKVKTAQAASARNQEVTNELAHKALGVPSDQPLMPGVFNNLRSQAGTAYQAVANAVPEIHGDPQFSAVRAGLGGANSQAAKHFPKITNNPMISDLIDDLEAFEHGPIPTQAVVEVVKELRFNGNANLRVRGDPSKNALGLAQRQAADAIDDLMERNISASGQPGLVDQYREARRLIARSYDVEAATNPATGDVRAHRLAALKARGRPLTGELDAIADAASAFPKAMQPPAAFGYEEPWSVLDMLGAGAAAMAGHPEGVGLFLGRPLARMGALSSPVQKLAGRTRGGPTPPPNEALQRGLRAVSLSQTQNRPSRTTGSSPGNFTPSP